MCRLGQPFGAEAQRISPSGQSFLDQPAKVRSPYTAAREYLNLPLACDLLEPNLFFAVLRLLLPGSTLQPSTEEAGQVNEDLTPLLRHRMGHLVARSNTIEA